MVSKIVSVVLVVVLVHVSLAAQDQLQSSTQGVAEIQKILHKAQKNGKAVKVTLNQKIDGHSKITGRVVEISDEGFTLMENKTGNTEKFVYDDVHQVNQAGLPKVVQVVLGAGIVFGVALVLFFALYPKT
jgi:ribosome maturation factor RimP